MENIKAQYNLINNKIRTNNNRLKELENNPLIIEYFSLMEENKELIVESENIEKEYQSKKYESEIKKMRECTHQYVIGNIGNEGYKYTSFYCIKCKLYTFFDNNMKNYEFLTDVQKQMGTIFNETRNQANFNHIICHPALADKIYNGIITKYPTISDKEMLKYFKTALHNIENKDNEKHIKHLGLRKNYKDYVI